MEAKPNGKSRRDFLRTSGLGAVAMGVGVGSIPSGEVSAGASPEASAKGGRRGVGPYNILFILVDQER